MDSTSPKQGVGAGTQVPQGVGIATHVSRGIDAAVETLRWFVPMAVTGALGGGILLASGWIGVEFLRRALSG